MVSFLIQQREKWNPRSSALKKKCLLHIRVIPKVRKTQHQNPEFGHTQGEINPKPAKKVQ
jgi:hypothetical protein